MPNLKHLIEAMAVRVLFRAFRTLPLDVASLAGSFMAQSIGPLLPAHKTAAKNLALAMPGLTKNQRYDILMRMWSNLGRVAAEMPHLPGTQLYQRMRMHGLENIPQSGTPVIFFSGHLGNWELTYPMAHQRHISTVLVYRQANNLYVDTIIRDLRASQCTDQLPKGHKGAFRLMRAIKDKQSLAMLVDQKMNDGIPIPFFGHDAMTAPAIAEFALRYDLPLVPARVVRTKGCHFEGYIYPPLVYEKTGDEETDVRTIMTQINRLLEEWIREHPEQWFWVHKRWPKHVSS